LITFDNCTEINRLEHFNRLEL